MFLFQPQYPEIIDQLEESNRPVVQIPEEQNTLGPQYIEAQKHSDVEHARLEENTVHNVNNKRETIKQTDGPVHTTLQELSIDDVFNETRVPQLRFGTKFYNTITGPIIKFMSAPKVSAVITNIGTCIVNGVMEIITSVFPAPLMPLIASVAGLVIPFEPVVMLREKMPVTSYRRAFKTAVNGFLGTFDKYKYEDDDPYMTQRFNRRFLEDPKEVNQ